MFAEPPIEVRVTQNFNASPEQVFDAWLDPAMLERWMFGPDVRDEEIVRLSLDARAGGRFSFIVRRDGDEIDHVGEYLEIDRPRRLVFTWGIAGVSVDESRVTIDITPRDGGSELSLA
ncbi:MAG TPA: SRPBCC family protein, partial [Gammaproteobacteria bacterium]